MHRVKEEETKGAEESKNENPSRRETVFGLYSGDTGFAAGFGGQEGILG